MTYPVHAGKLLSSFGTQPMERVKLMPDLKRVLYSLDKRTLLHFAQSLGFKGWAALSKVNF